MSWMDIRPDHAISIWIKERRAACVSVLILGNGVCTVHNTVCDGDVVVPVQRNNLEETVRIKTDFDNIFHKVDDDNHVTRNQSYISDDDNEISNNSKGALLGLPFMPQTYLLFGNDHTS